MNAFTRNCVIGITIWIAGSFAAPWIDAQTLDRYSAIAYSQSTGRWSAAWNYGTRAEAEGNAVAACNTSDCRPVIWVRNGYCALAVGDRVGASGFGWGGTAQAANNKALAECSARTTGCRLAVTVTPTGAITNPAPPPSPPPSPLPQNRFSAIAYSPSTGRAGGAWNFATQAEAESQARSRCGPADARVVTWVRNGYCALAVGQRTEFYGTGWAGNAQAASDKAMAVCATRSAGCRVVLIAPPTTGTPPVVTREPQVKILLIGLTSDPSLGRMIEHSMARLHEAFRGIPGLREQDFIELRGNAVTSENILRTVDRMNIRPNETLVCYYIGHGAYDPARARLDDLSGGHFFAIPNGDLMRKTLMDHLVARRARLTVLISDTCNVRAAANPSIAAMYLIPPGENPVLRDLFLGHSGVIDVSGSSQDQFGWFSGDSGGWFSAALVTASDPAQFRNVRFVSWDSFLARTSDLTSAEFHRRRDLLLRSPGNTSATVLGQLRGQSDQRPQVFHRDVRPLR